MGDKIDFLVEWAVWATLDSKKDLELILLKGHLLVEVMLDIALERKNIKGYKNYSFFKKVCCLEKIDVQDKQIFSVIIAALKDINTLRNKLAHEHNFKVENGELQSWAFKVLASFKGEKYSKYTFRTKIVHSFSVISINILNVIE